MEILLFISFIGFVIVSFKTIRHFEAKADAKRQQRSLDENTVWQLTECKISELSLKMLARHSDKEKIARIASSQIVSLIDLAIHPESLSKIFKNLGLFTATRNQWSTREIELSALIQQYITRDIDTHDLEVYQINVSRDKKPGFEELNKSFLTKVEKNGFIMDLALN